MMAPFVCSSSAVITLCLLQFAAGLPSRRGGCAEGEVSCADGSKCISERDWCDAFQDCDDNSDEADCESTTSCLSGEFLCEYDDVCFPDTYRCDGNMDCSDNADENNCEENGCEFASDFMCVSDRQCINAVLRCDHIEQCHDGSDELHCNYTEVLKYQPGDADTDPLQADVVGRCNADTELDCLGDGTECVALGDVCDGFDDCSNGADEQRINCIYGASAQIWIANGPAITQLNGDQRPKSVHVGGHALRLTYDHRTSQVFWIDSQEHTIKKMKMDGSDRSVLINTAIDTPTALAYDWIHGVLYWADSGLQHGKAKIEAYVVSSKHRQVLFTSPDIVDPRVMVVDPRPAQGYLYWGQAGSSKGIFRAGLDGSDKRCIVDHLVEHPTGLTIDFAGNQLLWIDSHVFGMQSWNLETQTQMIVYRFEENDEGLAGLAVFQDWIYWAEASDEAIYRINRLAPATSSSGGVTPQQVFHGVTNPNDLVIYHSVHQPAGENACATLNGGCSHMCLGSPMTVTRHRCACPNVGMIYSLNRDNRTCTLTATSGGGALILDPATGPGQNGAVVGVVIGAIILFVATVIGSIVLFSWTVYSTGL